MSKNDKSLVVLGVCHSNIGVYGYLNKNIYAKWEEMIKL